MILGSVGFGLGCKSSRMSG